MIGALAGMGAQFGVFVAGAYLALTGQGMTAGTIIMFVNLMNFMIQPASDLPGLLAARKAALGLIRKLADELEKNSEDTGTEEIHRLDQEIRLENVSFSYDAEKEVLHSLNTTFRAGGAYAVVRGKNLSFQRDVSHVMCPSANPIGLSRLFEKTRTARNFPAIRWTRASRPAPISFLILPCTIKG